MTRMLDAHRAPARCVAGAARWPRRCSPAARRSLVGGAVVGGAMVATDRRTSGAQVDDEAIEVQGQQPHARSLSATAPTSTSPATTAWCC